MFLMRFDPRLAPGTWSKAKMVDGQPTALACCVNGHIASLSGHDIAADGTVTPSLVCPEDGCIFHEFVQLDNWMREWS